ncbi:DUF4331 domain-containing protein [soil metagenome]
METNESCKKYRGMSRKYKSTVFAVAALAAMSAGSVLASSHREAPQITETPKVDGTDFYMFRSYEEGRGDFVTMIANYLPLQDAYGGPNYFALDEDAHYLIQIDNDGNARPDILFRFRFNNELQNIAVPTGPDANGNETTNTVPVLTTVPGGVGPAVTQTEGLNRIETYNIHVAMRSGGTRVAGFATNLGNVAGDGAGTVTFRKPVDNIGQKSINDYATYANNHIYDVAIPGCDADGARVFVGQRREGFVVNLGEVFDLINTDPLGPRDAEPNILDDKNITSIVMEVPIECLTSGDDPVIGGWTTARLPNVQQQSPDAPTRVQVSRLGSPLVNELVIGIDRKDDFNNSYPANDLPNFASFVTNPTLPVLIEALFGVPAPATPRVDLVQAFVTGVPGLTQPAAIAAGGGRPGEMLRLNTAVPAAPPADQRDLGFLACDLSGFPNGRRPIDDVVDIELTVVEGSITPENPNALQTCDLSGDAPTVVNEGAVVTDGARPDPAAYLAVFPYLNTPLPGSPTEATGDL